MDWKDALSTLREATPDDTPGTAADGSGVTAPGSDATPAGPADGQRGKLVVQMERKGRGGKTATIISGFTISDDAVAQVAALLKKRLGTGGSARGGEILIQGDRRADVAAALRALGFKA
ncbi:MAG: translation initiation factor [Candidatus Amulumruptor caecigallinarius]|nr:translation initiation factor [Candidatus Amulumruptor caecigallinarius]MCM1397052.1 translation initiation factor [Candidatus Amulumruptor caecigallinarius]MCM1454000.1 translation initiation factor [bacterium]